MSRYGFEVRLFSAGSVAVQSPSCVILADLCGWMASAVVVAVCGAVPLLSSEGTKSVASFAVVVAVGSRRR